ncbi:uncharacterized protein [Ptychodera flava]|uniref:uncharacterized protein n=1 Tax=Ptychodera flava TaxID=63121 RepID=UPI003969DD45
MQYLKDGQKTIRILLLQHQDWPSKFICSLIDGTRSIKTLVKTDFKYKRYKGPDVQYTSGIKVKHNENICYKLSEVTAEKLRFVTEGNTYTYRLHGDNHWYIAVERVKGVSHESISGSICFFKKGEERKAHELVFTIEKDESWSQQGRELNSLRVLFQKLSENLNQDDVKRMKTLLEGKQISVRESEKIEDAADIFVCLQKNGSLSESNLELLNEILKEIKKIP